MLPPANAPAFAGEWLAGAMYLCTDCFSFDALAGLFVSPSSVFEFLWDGQSIAWVVLTHNKREDQGKGLEEQCIRAGPSFGERLEGKWEQLPRKYSINLK